MITEEDVQTAYRLFLGREPENAHVVTNLLQTVTNWQQLREVFLSSAEFQVQFARTMDSAKHVRQRHPFLLPRIPVETSAGLDALDKMLKRIQQEWETLGDDEPYWSVITQPKYKNDRVAEHLSEFYRSGQYVVEVFTAAARRAGVNFKEIDDCLEIGCGVGRVTLYLARSFAKVIAADISAKHIGLAKEYLAEQNIQNVEFQRWSTPVELSAGPKVGAVFSVITLQHNPPPVMAWMLAALLKRLKANGVAFIQIPTYRNGYLFEVERYLHSPPPKLEMHFLPQQDIFRIIGESGCRCLEVREDGMVGEEDKMLSNTFLIQKLS